MRTLAMLLLLAAPSGVSLAELRIDRVWPERVHSRPGQRIGLEVRVTNPGKAAASATLLVELVHDLDVRRRLLSRPVTVEPGEPFIWRGAWRVEPLLGLELRATLLRDGKQLARRSEYFTCAPSVFQVLLSGRGAHAGMQFSGRLDKVIDTYPAKFAMQWRTQYGNFYDKFAWGPSDFDDLTPERDRWWSGQTGNPESKPNMVAVIDAMRRQGIRVVTYGKAAGGGPVGYENLRRRPELAGYTDGRPWLENYNAAYLDFLETLGPPKPGEQRMVPGKPEEMEKAGYKGAGRFAPFLKGGSQWCSVWYSCTRDEVADIGIGELVGSAKMFGFDGVRFDGEFFASRHRTLDGSFVVGKGFDGEAANARLVRRMKKACWRAKAGYLFGYNAATQITWSIGADNVPASFREKCRDDGLIANEALAFPGNVPWLDYARRVRREADIVRHYGGHHATYALNRNGDRLYNFIINFALRSHVMNWYQGPAIGNADLNRFATRFAALLWDRKLRTWADAEKHVAVNADRKIWWGPFAAARPASGRGTQFVLHLINPPEGKTTLSKQKLPAAPARNVRVVVNGLKGFRRAVLATFPACDVQPAKPTQAGGTLRFALPDIPYWSVLVLEADVPTPKPRWEAPPAEPAVKTPTAEDLQLAPTARETPGKPSWRKVLEPENRGGGETTADRVKDPDALNGGACHGKPGRPAGSMAYTYAYPRIPGKYKATFRLKVADNTADRPVFVLHIAHWVNHPIRSVPPLKNPTLTVKATDFKAPRTYQGFTIPFEYSDQGFLGVGCSYVGGTVGTHPRGVEGWWDRATLELVEPWSRERLLAHYAGFAPPKGLALRRDGALDVLVVRGLWNRHYRIDEALRKLPGKVKATSAYTTYHPQHDTQLKGFTLDWEPLFTQDVVVLANIETRGLGLGQVRMIGEFVKQGGGVVVLGGLLTLGQNWNMERGWPEFLPIKLDMPWEIHRCSPAVTFARPAKDSPLGGAMWPQPPVVLYRHVVTAKAGAVVLLAGSRGDPLLVGADYGKGRVVVFTGTVLGQAAAGQVVFWDSPAWPCILARAISWSHRR